MHTVLTYSLTFVAIIVSVFVTLLIKSELDQLFRDKNASIPFHISNVFFTWMTATCVNLVLTVYVFEEEFHIIKQLFILLAMIIPVYLLGAFLANKYQVKYRKYDTTENEKVIVLNEKYLKKKKRFSKLKDYNAFSKDK